MSQYYSGQGRLYVAERNADGTPKGFRALGNVPTLELSVEITKFEHTESMSGQRATDLTIVQEKKGTFTMTMEDMSPANLALALWGQTTANVAGTAETAVITAYLDSISALPYPRVSSVVIKDSGETTTYEFGTAVGTTAVPGGALNGWVNEETGAVTVFSDAEQTARSATVNIADEDELHITSYDYEANTVVDAFTETSQERWLRFEGLNTIDDAPVIVDIFKANLDPLSGYGLINEELSSFELTGSVLYDELQAGSSKFFRQINI